MRSTGGGSGSDARERLLDELAIVGGDRLRADDELAARERGVGDDDRRRAGGERLRERAGGPDPRLDDEPRVEVEVAPDRGGPGRDGRHERLEPARVLRGFRVVVAPGELAQRGRG